MFLFFLLRSWSAAPTRPVLLRNERGDYDIQVLAQVGNLIQSETINVYKSYSIAITNTEEEN